MKTYDVICPVCGHLNVDLYLEDSNGSMECEECGCVSRAKRTKPAFTDPDLRILAGGLLKSSDGDMRMRA